MIRAADAKEVGVEDPAEETFCHPNRKKDRRRKADVNTADVKFKSPQRARRPPQINSMNNQAEKPSVAVRPQRPACYRRRQRKGPRSEPSPPSRITSHASDATRELSFPIELLRTSPSPLHSWSDDEPTPTNGQVTKQGSRAASFTRASVHRARTNRVERTTG